MNSLEIDTELDILNNVVDSDPEMKQLLAHHLHNFALEDKLMIVAAYKKSGIGGVNQVLQGVDMSAPPQQPQFQHQ